MIKYYDKRNNRLVFTGNSASSQFWDSHWSKGDIPEFIKASNNPFIMENTKRYLPRGSKILEGGCGRGEKVYALQADGYDAYGVDFAEETVNTTKRSFPDLKIFFGDVRHLEFDDSFFDGYWSLGVIEHFFEGYERILQEMYRVLRRDGYLFMTVPAMSRLRRFKAKIGMYRAFEDGSPCMDDFYQFAMAQEDVIGRFNLKGFELIELHPYDGIKGLKDEIALLRPPLQWVYENTSFISNVTRRGIDRMTRHFANHMVFYIFRKR